MDDDLREQLELRIEIHLLGEFLIRINGVPLSRLNINRHQALIAYLALHVPRAVPRSEVAFRLWPDSNEEQALTNLRKALHQIKQTIPDVNLVLSDSHTVQLNLSADDHIDIAEFKSLLEAAEGARRLGSTDAEQNTLQSAVSLYRGDLLPHWFDEWLSSEREHVHDRFIQAADRLVALLETRKHYRDAIKYAQQLLQADRLREETYRTLIRLHAFNDDRAAALNVYHICASVLAKELGVEPDASTQELRERLLKNELRLPRAAVPITQISYPLIARQQEWNTLLVDWRRAARGDLHFTVLSGEAGIGKTRLAEDMLQWAARQGIRTGSAICYPADSQISYSFLSSWLRVVPLQNLDPRWRRELTRLLPELLDEEMPATAMTESWQKQVFFEAMARALASQQEPLLLFLDDLQWCDLDSLEWLRYFQRFDRTCKVLVLATLRTEEISTNAELQTMLLDLRAANQITEIELGRLNREQTGLLATELLQKTLSVQEIDTLFRESEGVPLFVVEIARESPKAGSIQTRDFSLAKQDALSPRLRALLEGKLMRLSMPARAVAESAAILGREFNLYLLKKISELDEGTTIAALDELWRRRMVRVRDGDVYDFSHDKLREAALHGLSPIRSTWLHQRAAEALELNATEDMYARIADHFEHAGLTSKSAEYYTRAANHAWNIFALHDALEHLRRAIRLETNRNTLADLYEQHGDISQLLERREQALEDFAQALTLTSGHLQTARLERKRVTLLSRYEFDLARESYQRALSELDLSKSESGYWHEWLETQFTWIEACYWQQNAKGIDELMEQIREPVEQHGTLLHKIYYKHRMISSAFVRERYLLNSEHVSIARENVALAVASENPYRISTAIRFLGMVAFCAEEWDVSESAHREAIQLCEKNNDLNSLIIAYVYVSFVHRRMQRTEDVLLYTRRLEETLQRVSANPQYASVVQANYAWLAYREGKIEQARQYATAALERWKALSSPYVFRWTALFVLFAIAVAEGKLDEVISHAQALLGAPQQRLISEVESALEAALETDSSETDRLERFQEALVKAKAAGYI